MLCAKAHNHKDCPVKEQTFSDKTKLKYANCEKVGHSASSHDCESYKEALNNFLKPMDRQQATSKNTTTTGRTFTSRKTSQGLSYSSAVVNKTTGSQNASFSAQSRLQNVQSSGGSLPTGVSPAADQLVKDLNPLLAGLNSPLEKFMVLSKLVDLCFGNV